VRKIFRLEKEEVTGDWRKLNKKLCNLYSSQISFREDETGRACSMYQGEEK